MRILNQLLTVKKVLFPKLRVLSGESIVAEGFSLRLLPFDELLKILSNTQPKGCGYINRSI